MCVCFDYALNAWYVCGFFFDSSPFRVCRGGHPKRHRMGPKECVVYMVTVESALLMHFWTNTFAYTVTRCPLQSSLARNSHSRAAGMSAGFFQCFSASIPFLPHFASMLRQLSMCYSHQATAQKHFRVPIYLEIPRNRARRWYAMCASN